MKRSIYFFIMVVFYTALHAQSNVSSPMNFHIENNSNLPKLDIVGKISFKDQDNNQAIDANEKSRLIFYVENSGLGDAYNCEVRVSANGATKNVNFDKLIKIDKISANSTKKIEVPIYTNTQTIEGEITFDVYIFEPYGYGSNNAYISISTHKFKEPNIVVNEYLFKTQNGIIKKRENFNLEVLIQNIGQGTAKDVYVSILLPNEVYLQSGEKKYYIPAMAPGETKIMHYELNGTMYASQSNSIKIDLSESLNSYAQDSYIRFNFDDNTSTKTVIDPINDSKVIPTLSLRSDVDIDIPMSKTKAYNTYALIIANENYTSAPNVSYAINDGKSFRDYCIKTLGVPESNIQYVTNATGNTLKAQINQLQNNIRILNGQAKIIVYYAGHGIPDDVHGNGNAYLLPVDGMANDPTTAYKLDDLYAALGEYETQGITIFIDACFSGGTRDINKTVYGDVRGVAVRVKRGQPQGNMVVFSAAQNNQTANSYPDQQHGLFTYYLLKKLKEEKGEISLNDLSEAVIKAVRLESNRHNAYQEPCIIASPAADTNWRNWKLK